MIVPASLLLAMLPGAASPAQDGAEGRFADAAADSGIGTISN
jgi:hypothetical protein